MGEGPPVRRAPQAPSPGPGIRRGAGSRGVRAALPRHGLGRGSRWCVTAGVMLAWGLPAVTRAAEPSPDPEGAHAKEERRSGNEDAMPPGLETRIHATGERGEPRRERLRLGSAAWLGSSPEEALEGLSQVQLNRDGGPLAPVRLTLRGLSGARVGTSWNGLRVDDPGVGGVDAAMLPLYASAFVEDWAGSDAGSGPGTGLALGGGAPQSDAGHLGARARLGVGSLATLRSQGIVAGHLPDGTALSLGGAGGSSAGDFRFVPHTRGGGPSPSPQTRENNDQARASAFLSARHRGEEGSWHASALAAAHEGGVPGFATAPTDGLRGTRQLAGVVAGASRYLSPSPAERAAPPSLELSGQWQALVTEQRTHAPQRAFEDGVRAGQQRADAAISWRPGTFGSLDTQLQVALAGGGAWLEHQDASEAPFWRGQIGVQGGVVLRHAPSALRAMIALGVEGFSDVGTLPHHRAGMDWQASPALTLGVHVSRSARPPTLDELFAPRGFVRGNPKLSPEQGHEGEVYLHWHAPPGLRARLAVFAGVLDDAIVYLSRNAFEIQAMNTGPLRRVGAGGQLSFHPVTWLALDLSANALHSELALTGAPLPTVPPLRARMQARLGDVHRLHGFALLRHRSATSSTLFGTLTVPGYALADLGAVLPLTDAIALGMTWTNVFDVQDAQDVNLLPLPGRQWFCTLEVRHE